MKSTFDKFLPPLFLLVCLGWLASSINWYVCDIYKKCKIAAPIVVTPVIEAPVPAQKAFETFYSEINSSEIFITDKVSEAYPEIKYMTVDKNKELHITGLYFNDETKNIGLQRAKNAKEYFQDYPWYGQIKTFAKKINSNFASTKYDEFAKSVLVNINDISDKFKVIGENIYFATNSTRPQKSTNIQTYLKSVAESFKAGKISRIKIIGHTDNQGNRNTNIQLGQQRANTIRSMLVDYGVNAKILKSISEGPDSPAESNSTKEGRALNRRVQLIIK